MDNILCQRGETHSRNSRNHQGWPQSKQSRFFIFHVKNPSYNDATRSLISQKESQRLPVIANWLSSALNAVFQTAFMGDGNWFLSTANAGSALLVGLRCFSDLA